MKNTATDQGKNIHMPGPFRFFLDAVAVHPVKTFSMMLFELLQAATILIFPFILRDLIDAVALYDPGAQNVSIWDAVHEPFRNFIIVSIFLVVVSRASGTALGFLAPVLRKQPRTRLFSHLQHHPMNFFQTSHSGALGNKINEACNGLAMTLWTFAFEVWPILVKLCVSVVLLFTANAMLGLSMLCWMLAYLPVTFFFARKQSRQMERISRERSRLTGKVVDMATNIQSVKAFAHETHENRELEMAMEREIRETFRFSFIRETGGWFHSLSAFAVTLLLLYLTLDFYGQGVITAGDIAFVFSLILIVTDQARNLIWGMTHFLEHLGQLSDGVHTIMRPHILSDKKDARELELRTGEITYRNVSFQYPETSRAAIRDLCLTIPPGEKLGLIGQSGAGKSTLVTLLLRFYDIDAGQILIDDQNIADVTQNSLRRNIAVIPQDTSLFHRTLMDNIRYGRLEATDDEVIEAAKKAHAHEFITALPEGYQTLVGERGVKLSGGQRQRIAIARAVLKNAPILVLDEATSALDSESEKLIQDSLEELMQGKTVIAIAHRLSTIAHLDRLVVMSDGRIVEDGNHGELLAGEGIYARLWAMQSGGFLPE